MAVLLLLLLFLVFSVVTIVAVVSDVAIVPVFTVVAAVVSVVATTTKRSQALRTPRDLLGCWEPVATPGPKDRQRKSRQRSFLLNHLS